MHDEQAGSASVPEILLTVSVGRHGVLRSLAAVTLASAALHRYIVSSIQLLEGLWTWRSFPDSVKCCFLHYVMESASCLTRFRSSITLPRIAK